MIKRTLLATTAATAFAALTFVVSPSFADQGNPMGVQMAQTESEGSAGAAGGHMQGQMQGQMPGQMQGQMPGQMQGRKAGRQGMPGARGAGAAAPCPGMTGGHGKGHGMMGHGKGGGMHGRMHGRMHGGMMGHGMMGHGMMGGMMGGMMSPGMGPGGPFATNKDLSAENIKDIIEGHFAWMGNKRLTAGKVTKMDESTYLAEVVTVDGSLVQKFEVDRNTGSMRPVR